MCLCVTALVVFSQPLIGPRLTGACCECVCVCVALRANKGGRDTLLRPLRKKQKEKAKGKKKKTGSRADHSSPLLPSLRPPSASSPSPSALTSCGIFSHPSSAPHYETPTLAFLPHTDTHRHERTLPLSHENPISG